MGGLFESSYTEAMGEEIQVILPKSNGLSLLVKLLIF